MDLFKNPMVKKLALSQLKKMFDTDGTKIITIQIVDNEFKFESHNEEMVVVKKTYYETLLKIIQDGDK